jgi:hypothetical protein
LKSIESIKVFEEKHVRTLWDGEQEQWYVSIIDVIGILTLVPIEESSNNA